MINGTLLILVPTALCFSILVKIVRIQTRTRQEGVWHQLALLLKVKSNHAERHDGENTTVRQRKEAVAFMHYTNGIINDVERQHLLDYFEAGHTQWVFVSSPEELHTGELVMDWLVEVCKACPCRFKQGVDWAGSSNSYAEDMPKWAAMAPLMKAWVDAIRLDDLDGAAQIIHEIAPILKQTSWYSNYKGKARSCMQFLHLILLLRASHDIMLCARCSDLPTGLELISFCIIGNIEGSTSSCCSRT